MSERKGISFSEFADRYGSITIGPLPQFWSQLLIDDDALVEALKAASRTLNDPGKIVKIRFLPTRQPKVNVEPGSSQHSGVVTFAAKATTEQQSEFEDITIDSHGDPSLVISYDPHDEWEVAKFAQYISKELRDRITALPAELYGWQLAENEEALYELLNAIMGFSMDILLSITTTIVYVNLLSEQGNFALAAEICIALYMMMSTANVVIDAVNIKRINNGKPIFSIAGSLSRRHYERRAKQIKSEPWRLLIPATFTKEFLLPTILVHMHMLIHRPEVFLRSESTKAEAADDSKKK